MTRILRFSELLDLTEGQRAFLSAHSGGKPVTDDLMGACKDTLFTCAYDWTDAAGILRHSGHGVDWERTVLRGDLTVVYAAPYPAPDMPEVIGSWAPRGGGYAVYGPTGGLLRRCNATGEAYELVCGLAADRDRDRAGGEG